MAVDLDGSATMLNSYPEITDVGLIYVDLSPFWVGGMNRIEFYLFSPQGGNLGHVQRR